MKTAEFVRSSIRLVILWEDDSVISPIILVSKNTLTLMDALLHVVDATALCHTHQGFHPIDGPRIEGKFSQRMNRCKLLLTFLRILNLIPYAFPS